MNTKKNKGKSKLNKAPNPNPPQKIEESGKVTENIEDVSVGEIDSAQKSDIRVPEIISDVIIPAVEVKEKEDDSPKKPKRNRGKKKKQEKDEDEDQDEKPTESIDIIEIVEVKPQESLTEENVPPSARKKKNKNKKVVDPEPKSTEKVETIVSETEQKKTQETELSVKEDIAPQNVTDQEAKQPKKKNKKKKRNDSERSEKADELSCTAAFQKLLKDDNTEIKTADDQPIEDIKTLAKSEKDVPKGEKQDLNKESLKPESEKPEQYKNTAQDVPTTSMNESGGKNKKKNKKDKKELPKDKETKDFDTPDIESDFDMPEIVPITDLIPSSEELTKSVGVQEKVKEEKITEDKSESKAPEEIKPKAKIAKPVERKRKGKEDSQAQDLPEVSTPEDRALPISEIPKGEAVTSKVEEIKTEVPGIPVDFIPSKENKQDVSSKIEKPTENIPEIKATELIDVPEMDKNKKRKKSPKPGKAQQITETSDQAEIKTEIPMEKDIQPAVTTTEISVTQTIVEVKSQDAIITQAFEELIRIPESDKSKKRKKSPKPSKLDQKPKIVPETSEPVIAIQEEIKPGIQMGPKIEEELKPLSATEGIESPKESASEKPTASVVEKSNIELLPEKEDTTPDDAKILDTKSKKKRKKSPKLPFGPETAAETKDTVTASGVTSEKQEKLEKDSNIQSEEISQSKSDVLYDMPSAEDLEIRSLKADESEGSTCGFTPDIIQHPRATSQDLIDDNNNMFIQEITIEEVQLQIPTDMPDTPFIQGSGETPLKTPESIFTRVQISEMNIDAGKGEQEKTDIKSKMMEVNQDMEELRLSIERSLAELTAIEKSEGEVERKLEEKAAHIPNVPKSPEVKISMPSELIFKSQLENVETPTPKEKQIKEVVASAEVVVSKPAEAGTFSTISFEKESENKNVQMKMSEKSTSVADMSKPAEKKTDTITPPTVPARKDKSKSKERDIKNIPMKPSENIVKPADIATETPTPDCVADTPVPPAIPARKDNKNKGKNKKKGKQDVAQTVTQTESASTSAESKEPAVKEETTSKEEKKEQKSDTKQDKGKQHSATQADDKTPSDQEGNSSNPSEFEPIENFEDAMTSSADDINKTFEMIANEATQSQFVEASHVNPEIKIVAPIEDTKPDKKDEKVNPVSPPKNLLGHPDIPVPSNRTDYKKEKNKAPNTIVAKVKIKDAVQIEGKKQTKDTQTDNIRKFMKTKSIDESFTSVTNENDEFVYKYSFRKVFLQSACHVCKKELKQTRVPCNFCNLIFYCNVKHKDEDWAKHQGFCFAVSTIVHLKDQKHIYADSKNITGQDYRLLRMQMIVSCEKVLKRKLTPFEQEALLYPRVCADAACREWRQSKLADCDGCGQISYCSDQPEHFPKTHQRWCKSYSLYQKLVCYQQTQGRLEPKLPSKIMVEPHQLSEKMNEVLAAMYEEKIDMNDIQYAALTQIATAPLTAAFCLQTYAKLANPTNGISKKTTCTIHIVGGELQFEADALNKWEVFFLHLRPDLQELRVVMVGRDLNPSNLPLELLGKVKLCESCRSNKRRVVFSFQDKTTYHDFWASDDFVPPDIVCAFNPSIKRSSMYNGKDPWPKTINCVLKLKIPFLITAYTMNELLKDLSRIKECSEVDHKVVIEQKFNSFASVRPDRNFISDDEMPLLFKNYCYILITGAN